MTVIVRTNVADGTAMFDLPADMAATFDALSEARYARMEAEKREKALKAEILAALPPREKGVKFVLRVAGVIRANVSTRSRTSVNASALLAEFPEAFQALATESTYDTVNPA